MASVSLPVPNADRVSDTAFNNDGTLLAFLYVDGSVHIFQADEKRTFTHVCETQPCCRRATSISFASSEIGSIFVIAEENGRTFLYERVSQTEFAQAATIQPHKAPINSVAFAPAGLVYACGASDGFVSLTTCDMKTWRFQTTRVSDKPVTSISWSPPACMSFIENPTASDTARLVAASADGFFTVLGVRHNVLVPKAPPVAAHEGAINCIAWRPLAGFSRWEIATCGQDKLVKLFTRETHEQDWTCVTVCECQEEPVAVKWSQCGFMMSVSEGDQVRIFREDAGKWIEMIE